MDEWRSSAKPLYSVIVPVHNKADLIERILSAFIRTTRGDWELVVVLDGCVDNSTARPTPSLRAALLPARRRRSLGPYE